MSEHTPAYTVGETLTMGAVEATIVDVSGLDDGELTVAVDSEQGRYDLLIPLDAVPLVRHAPGSETAADALVNGTYNPAIHAVNELIRAHMVSPHGIAARADVSRQAVTMWLGRHHELADLVVARVGQTPLFWWPQVKAALHELGLPNAAAREAQRRRAEAKRAVPADDTRTGGGASSSASSSASAEFPARKGDEVAAHDVDDETGGDR